MSQRLCCIGYTVGPWMGWQQRCCLLCSSTVAASGWPQWPYPVYRQSPMLISLWWGHELGQLSSQCQNWCHNSSGRLSVCLCSVPFGLHGSICLLSAHHNAAFLAGTYQTYDTHDLPTQAMICYVLHVCSLCLLSDGLPYLEPHPAIWCGQASWGITCGRSSTVLHKNYRLSKTHKHTTRKAGWLHGTPWVWYTIWYLFYPTHCLVVFKMPHLHMQFCSWPLCWCWQGRWTYLPQQAFHHPLWHWVLCRV